MKNSKVIVRTRNAGVYFGTLVEHSLKTVTLNDVRKLWYWDGAAAVEQLALEGTKYPEKCKFTVTVSNMVISNWEQIIPCTQESINSIEAVKEWKL